MATKPAKIQTSVKSSAKPVTTATKPVHKTGAKLVRRYAWRPDVPDHRDRVYKARKISKPEVVERIGLDNPIEDQGSLGSCTGNAATSMLEIKLKTAGLSRLMAYYNGRVVDHTTMVDDGAQIRSVIKGLMKSGVSLEKTWPYDIAKFAQKPTPKAFTEAKTLVVGEITKRKLSYQRVLTLEDMVNAIACGNTVTFGFMVPQSFETLPASGLLALPKKNELTLGGHAVVAVGYDLKKKFIWVRNSWGTAWGIDGYFKMPFSWFTDSRRLVDDMWTIQ